MLTPPIGEPAGLTDENLQPRIRGTFLMALTNASPRLARAHHRQQERAGRRLLHPLRRHRRRLRRDQGRAEDSWSTTCAATSTSGPAARSSPSRSSPSHRRPSSARPARRPVAAALRGARPAPRGLRRARPHREPSSWRRASTPSWSADHPARRRRGVQAPAEPARPAHHPEGVRQGPPDADHEPVRPSTERTS